MKFLKPHLVNIGIALIVGTVVSLVSYHVFGVGQFSSFIGRLPRVYTDQNGEVQTDTCYYHDPLLSEPIRLGTFFYILTIVILIITRRRKFIGLSRLKILVLLILYVVPVVPYLVDITDLRRLVCYLQNPEMRNSQSILEFNENNL